MSVQMPCCSHTCPGAQRPHWHDGRRRAPPDRLPPYRCDLMFRMSSAVLVRCCPTSILVPMSICMLAMCAARCTHAPSASNGSCIHMAGLRDVGTDRNLMLYTCTKLWKGLSHTLAGAVRLGLLDLSCRFPLRRLRCGRSGIALQRRRLPASSQWHRGRVVQC